VGVALIELKDLRKSYWLGGGELRVLKDINLTIEEGEFVAIVGPSGSGKSTVMQILGLLDRPTQGTYRLLGNDVSNLSDDQGAALRSRTIGFIFQMFNLLSRTSAMENVELPMIYSGAPNREERAKEVLSDVGLADRMDHKPNQLSGGQQQRVAIARALVNHPKIIFADEPTGNLASDQAEDILRQLQEMNKSGITVIMVTHDPDIAAHARRIIHIKDGNIVSDERKDDKPNVRSPSSGGPQVSVLQTPPFSMVELKEYGASALRAISANKVRSALSMLGILIGVAAVIAMLAIGRGAQKAVEAQLAGLGSNLLMLIPNNSSAGAVRLSAGSISRLTMDDVNAIARCNPNVARVDGNVSGSVQVVYKNQNWNTSVTGALPIYETMRNSKPYYGRFYTAEENRDQARVALLGQTVINNLFGKQNPVDKKIEIEHIDFRVIGVLPMKGATGFRDQDDTILVPLDTAMNRVLGKKYFNNIWVECATPESIPDVIRDMTTLMRKRHRLPSWKDDDFDIRNMADIVATRQATTNTFTILLGIVATISLLVGGTLLVGGIGIMNIMLVSVSERTREIGLRKAVGAARRAILTQFLMESALLSTIGGLIGIALGVTISFSMSKFAGWAAEVTPQSVLLAFVFSASVGIIFGFWPARKASLLSPIEALRYE
jgi:macrolide transport system ATP-binding/permease protein